MGVITKMGVVTKVRKFQHTQITLLFSTFKHLPITYALYNVTVYQNISSTADILLHLLVCIIRRVLFLMIQNLKY